MSQTRTAPCGKPRCTTRTWSRCADGCGRCCSRWTPMTDIPDEAVQARSRSGASTVTECNATLTTATVHDCPNGSRVNASGYCKVCRDNYVTLLRTIKCERHDEDAFYPHSAQGAAWRDDTPGATPHKPPLVSDEEVTAALVVIGKDLLRGYDTEVSTVRAALEAAAKVRQSNE